AFSISRAVIRTPFTMTKASGRTCDSHAQSSTALTGCGLLLALIEVGVVFVTDTVGVCDCTTDDNAIIEPTSAYKILLIVVSFWWHRSQVDHLSVDWMCINGLARIMLRADL